ncbi:MAG: DNA mismatch repair protein MutS [Proteobacteria bacterium]|nr:DNA mismatch repair protein MutS [Pseudomonadota bacterium]
MVREGRRYTREAPFDPSKGLLWNADTLTADLALTTLFEAMSSGDHCIFEAARLTVLGSEPIDLETIRYRQQIIQDCLHHPSVVRDLYNLAVEATEKQEGRFYHGLFSRQPDSVLRDGLETMTRFLVFLRKLRTMADTHADKFSSPGWTTFFSMIKHDLDEDYFSLVQYHMDQLKFRHGELLSATLGPANRGKCYLLHQVPHYAGRWSDWWRRLFEEKRQIFSFELHPRDEAGSRALNDLRNRGIALAANALSQSGDHVRDFFFMLRAELAFHVGCLNLHERLTSKGEPTSMPRVSKSQESYLFFRGLYDAGLALSTSARVVGNDADANGKILLMITGPNTGGKSTFLRSVGLAQLMMQAGMFVAAESFSASLADGVMTHFKREEDVAMESGKFDEEMRRMSQIVDHCRPHAVVFFNESFAATNEREGSEIGRQIISALLEGKVRVLFVTHMFELANGFYQQDRADMLFLRAARQTDGTRTFKLTEDKPLPTSFGQDLYYRIFGESPDQANQNCDARLPIKQATS